MQSIEDLQKLLQRNSLTLAIVNMDDEPLYVQPAYIRKHYSMSSATVFRRLQEMKLLAKYKDSFIVASSKKPLVKLADFIEFIKERGLEI